MIRSTTKRTGDAEFDRVFEVRERFWIRSARPGTYYLSFWQALKGWWYEKWPARLMFSISDRYGQWYVRSSRDTLYGPWILKSTALKLAREFDQVDPGLAMVERK